MFNVNIRVRVSTFLSKPIFISVIIFIEFRVVEKGGIVGEEVENRKNRNENV